MEKHTILGTDDIYKRKDVQAEKRNFLWKCSHYNSKYMSYSMYKCHRFVYIFIILLIIKNIKMCQIFNWQFVISLH